MRVLLTMMVAVGVLVSGFFITLIYQERCHIPISLSVAELGAVKFLSDAVDRYELEVGNPPSDLGVLVPKYVPKIPEGFFGQEFQYDPKVSSDRRVYSYGSDHVKGGIGAAQDLYRTLDVSNLIDSVYKPIFGCNA